MRLGPKPDEVRNSFCAGCDALDVTVYQIEPDRYRCIDCINEGHMPYENMNRSQRRAAVKYAAEEAAKRPAALTPIPRAQWPNYNQASLEQVWHSQKFLVQLFGEVEFQGIECKRLSICRVTLQADGRWDAGITWDELYAIKSELGFSEWYGLEIHPPVKDLVNVANMRHLWLLREPLQLGWKRGIA